ncbi:methionyl-tRNA formyltransferase [Actinoplanes regularis]|uniref:Methionyl-tRNA formyltransferase n=1 Tax=Actinoplanes regularis TaxID=52697 RepID=A0A239HA93_9ACTN|nr:methionyl-tRNA formyltransferase [Actinoplanes regularis]GIE90965.1 methionyl-tRNA formyltransferase [Actinoplanes regularis]SNS78319.1 methionyl-tRNA formyltransferase [Actinoplanes regularis]
MKIVFFGYGQLGATVLRGIAPHHEVLLVLTHRADFSGLGEPDVEEAAAELGLPVRYSAGAREPELHDHLRRLAPELIVSTNWRTQVPMDVLRIPEHGAINTHDALLPAYAGFGAVNWAIRNGEEETGLTVHYMAETLDTGPVLARARVKIGPQDTADYVLRRLLDEYVPVTLEALERVAAGDLGEPQQTVGASFYHRIGAADTRIDWSDSATTICNLVRGQSDPFVNAWTTHRGLRLWVKAAVRPTRAYGGTPGRVVKAEDGGVVVACGRPADGFDRGVILLQVATETGPPVRAVDYFGTVGDYLH